jgi:hypothetical protein
VSLVVCASLAVAAYLIEARLSYDAATAWLPGFLMFLIVYVSFVRA